MSDRCCSTGAASDGGSADAGGEAFCVADPQAPAHRSAKSFRHVAFLVERDLEGDRAELPRPLRPSRHGGYGGGRRGLEDNLSWSGQAEADALRQRALQCGDDFARVARGLGYAVVAHTPLAPSKGTLKESVVMPAVVPSPEKPPGSGFTAAVNAARRSSSGADPLCPPTEVAPASGASAPSRASILAAFMRDGDVDSCSTTRSNSPGTEDEVGLVPVLSPLLGRSDSGKRHIAVDDTTRTLETPTPQPAATSVGLRGYTVSASPSLHHEFSSAAEGGGGSRGVSSPLFRPMPSTVVTAVRTWDIINASSPIGINNMEPAHYPPEIGEPLPSQASSSPRSSSTLHSLVDRGRHPPSPVLVVPVTHSNTFPMRLSLPDVAVSRTTSSLNTSVSIAHLNGAGPDHAGETQHSNGLFTPSAEVLNIPAVPSLDDETSLRSNGRSIQ